MSRISFPKKPRKDVFSGLYGLPGDNRIFIGKNWALQNDIDEAKAKTRARACFKECRTCGACANSKRDNFQPRAFVIKNDKWVLQNPHKSYDANAGKWVNCRDCEPFRFHDCHNGVFRDSRQEPEPFTPDVIKLLKESGGRPLI